MIKMSWQDIFKRKPIAVVGQMTPEQSTDYGRAVDMDNIVKLITMTMRDLDADLMEGRGMGGYDLPEEAKNKVRKLVRDTAKAMAKKAEEDMDKWKTHSHWEGVL